MATETSLQAHAANAVCYRSGDLQQTRHRLMVLVFF